MDVTATLCLVSALAVAVGGNNKYHTLSVTSQHMAYICPEGANVTLVCSQAGAKAHPVDRLQHLWLYTPHMEQHCQPHIHPRPDRKANQSLGVVYDVQPKSFSVTLLNVTQSDQGRYCCFTLDILVNGNHKGSMQQTVFSHMLLSVTPRRNESVSCTVYDNNSPQGSVAAGFATAACILGILCLPLILVLVYRQRQGAHQSRRAHELVRMDSEAQGHENPVFMGSTPQPKTRSLTLILTRQTSESGRHLLSDPGTPITPNVHGEMFFPSQEPIPESPDFLQV
ncbi:V-type immunoglobulin domain-containing suppressor of T-cell activation [Hoplias malabaricus]|uniref:V-type immunoglobulin domain-containing suppressor of T-cell activation n=1 Tax=Hoplias malabaricus TaxID=27720 RepID=UPI0034617E64